MIETPDTNGSWKPWCDESFENTQMAKSFLKKNSTEGGTFRIISVKVPKISASVEQKVSVVLK